MTKTKTNAKANVVRIRRVYASNTGSRSLSSEIRHACLKASSSPKHRGGPRHSIDQHRSSPRLAICRKRWKWLTQLEALTGFHPEGTSGLERIQLHQPESRRLERRSHEAWSSIQKSFVPTILGFFWNCSRTGTHGPSSWVPRAT